MTSHFIRVLNKSILVLTTLIVLSNSGTALAKSYGFRFSPLFAAAGIIDLKFDFAATDKLLLIPSILYWNTTILNYNTKVTGYGFASTYHFDGVFNDSWYLGGGVASISAVVENDLAKGEATGVGVSALGGYTWAWEHFYMNLGASIGSSSVKEVKAKSKTTGEELQKTDVNASTAVGLEFSIGWAF